MTIAPRFQKPVKCWKNVREASTLCSSAYQSLGGEAWRDEELLERWRRSQGIAPEAVAQHAEEARANLLEARE